MGIRMMPTMGQPGQMGVMGQPQGGNPTLANWLARRRAPQNIPNPNPTMGGPTGLMPPQQTPQPVQPQAGAGMTLGDYMKTMRRPM